MNSRMLAMLSPASASASSATVRLSPAQKPRRQSRWPPMAADAAVEPPRPLTRRRLPAVARDGHVVMPFPDGERDGAQLSQPEAMRHVPELVAGQLLTERSEHLARRDRQVAAGECPVE